MWTLGFRLALHAAALFSTDLTFDLDFCSNPTAASERGRDHNSGDLGKQAVKRSGRLLVVSLDLRHKNPPARFKDGLGLSNELQMYG